MISEKQITLNNIYDLNFVHYEQEINESHPIVINVGRSYTDFYSSYTLHALYNLLIL